MEKEDFRPWLAFRRTLPAAIFLSLLATIYLSTRIGASPYFSFTIQKLNSVEGLFAIVVFAGMTVLSSPLAVIYTLRTHGYRGLRCMYLLLNVVALLIVLGATLSSFFKIF